MKKCVNCGAQFEGEGLELPADSGRVCSSICFEGWTNGQILRSFIGRGERITKWLKEQGLSLDD